MNPPMRTWWRTLGEIFLHSKMLTHKRKFVLMLIIWTYKCWCKGWQYSTLSKPQTWTLSPTHNLTTTTCGWLANITHGILFRILLSHCYYLGPTLPLSLPGLHGLTQHVNDDWEDTSHVSTRYDTLTIHGYNFALVKNAKCGMWVPCTNQE